MIRLAQGQRRRGPKTSPALDRGAGTEKAEAQNFMRN
jgi:hypothetical protein